MHLSYRIVFISIFKNSNLRLVHPISPFNAKVILLSKMAPEDSFNYLV